MEQYGIIGAFEEYAQSKGWHNFYGIDTFYRSAATVQQYNPGELIFVYAFRATPTKVNGRTTEITYNCLMMLGRKFDETGEAASLDETSQQKYDRRLKELMQLLDIAIGEIACNNELEVTPGEIVPDINQFAENIDFAAATNVIYVQ
jgi:hypothetical protein